LDAIARLQAEPEALRSLPVRTGVRTRSGDIRQVDWVITLLFGEDGQFSHYVASGIDVTAQLQMEIELQEARRLMDERENAMQRSLARSLHDGPVQELLSLSHAAADMQTRAQADQLWTSRQRLEELIPALEIVRRKLVSVATGLRVLIAELRPPGLEEMGLRQALEVLLHQYSEGLEPPWPEVTLTIDSSVELLQEPTHTALYYLIREALRNVQRHAQASKAEVVVRVEADRVHLLVRDDGCGFVVPDRLTRLVHDQKYGLVGMEERVRLRGGEMTIESRPGQGTTVRVSFPIEQLRR
jgi:signal transduction histidine kinase